jgi:hypothetical protein
MGRSRSRRQDKFLKILHTGIGFNYQSVIWEEKKKEKHNIIIIARSLSAQRQLMKMAFHSSDFILKM